MTRRQDLLDREDRGWRALCERFDTVRAEDWERPGACGDWNPKDVLAHVAAWHAEAAHELEARAAGRWRERAWPDARAFDAEAYDRCRHLTLREVQAMSGAARHRFREEVARARDEVLERAERWVIDSGHAHYERHVPDLDAFLGAVRG